MPVDTSVIGKPTGAWRVVLDRAVLANFAKSVGDTSRVYQREEAARAAGLAAVPYIVVESVVGITLVLLLAERPADAEHRAD